MYKVMDSVIWEGFAGVAYHDFVLCKGDINCGVASIRKGGCGIMRFVRCKT